LTTELTTTTSERSEPLFDFLQLYQFCSSSFGIDTFRDYDNRRKKENYRLFGYREYSLSIPAIFPFVSGMFFVAIW
jgi:hypothetical protein